MKFLTLMPILGLAAGAALSADVAIVDEIVAKVNGDIVTRSEIDRTRRLFEEEIKKQGAKGNALAQALKDRERDFLRERIDQLLLVQKGKELNINVDSEISKYMADLMRKLGAKDSDSFALMVREQTGMNIEDFKSETKNGMLTQRVIGQEVMSRISVPKSDLQKYYKEHEKEFIHEERVYLRELLISTEGKDEKAVAAAEKKAKDLVARARKGEKFGDLARDNSDAATASQLGELGWFKKNEMDAKIEPLVFGQERGTVTDPIKRPNGFLILRVDEAQKQGLATFEEVEPEIRDKVLGPRAEPKIREFLTKLRADAFLEIKSGFQDSGAAPNKDTTWQDPAVLKPETVTKQEVASRTRKKKLLGLMPVPGTAVPAMQTNP